MMRNENMNEPQDPQCVQTSVSDSAGFQTTMFSKEENICDEHYIGMPEYNNIVVPEPYIVASFKFRNQEDFDFFNDFLKKNLYKENKIFDGMQRKNIKSTWFPLTEKASKYRYENE